MIQTAGDDDRLSIIHNKEGRVMSVYYPFYCGVCKCVWVVYCTDHEYNTNSQLWCIRTLNRCNTPTIINRISNTAFLAPEIHQ